MPKTDLSLATIGKLSDWRAHKIINKALDLVAADLDDRGNDEKPRKVTVTIEFVKDVNEDTVKMDVRAKATVPDYRTPTTLGKIKQGTDGAAKIVFQTDAADNPDQETMFDTEDERKAE